MALSANKGTVVNKHKSTSYVRTLDAKSSSDMEVLEVIRQTVRVINKFSPAKKRVVLRGRKPEVKMMVSGKVNPVSYDWGGNVVGGIANATVYDVYVYDRRR